MATHKSPRGNSQSANLTAPAPIPAAARLTRSPGAHRLSGVLSPQNLALGGQSMDRSSSALSSASSNSVPQRPLPRRRSTDASTLDYYWSSLAGAGASSSNSSLALSASPGAGFALGSSSGGMFSSGALNKIRSHSALSTGRQEGPSGDEGQLQSQTHLAVRPDFERRESETSASTSSSGPIYLSSPSDQVSPIWPVLENFMGSPIGASIGLGAMSSERSYSYGTESSESQYSPVEYRTAKDLTAASSMSSEPSDNRWEARSSTTSGATYVPSPESIYKSSEGPVKETEPEHFNTPVAPAWREPSNQSPQYVFAYNPDSSSGPRSQTTPVTGSSSSRYTPTNPPNSGLYLRTPRNADSGRASELGSGGTPRSAPAWKSDFGSAEGDQKDETLKGRNRRTLPAVVSGKDLAGIVSDDGGESYPAKSGQDKGPRSPTVPARSALRSHITTVFPVDSNNRPLIASPISLSPPKESHTLPVITHTPHSPFPSPPDNKPARPNRSPSRESTPVFSSSASISELTDMLGGAIDAIGLIDSRETPPPMTAEPDKRHQPTMSLDMGSGLEPAAEVADRAPMTPTSLPARGTSLASSGLPNGQGEEKESASESATAGVASSLPSRLEDHERKASSTLSTGSYGAEPQTLSPVPLYSPTIISFNSRPWPSAMKIGHIKALKAPGERALAYARAINELARAESGIREWCILSAEEAHRPVSRAPSKLSAVTSFGHDGHNGISNPQPLSPYDPSPHPRNVSTGSEFPMRADSFTAREISQRILGPGDQPTALPANLPYPQLQAQASNFNAGGALKPSPSMQSVASFASSKRGFFSAIRKGNSTKKESMSLGPPGAGGYAGGSVGKKDVRGLPISGPTQRSSPSPQKERGEMESASPIQNPRVQASVVAPMGPRGPRGGTITPLPTGPGSPVDRGEAPRGRASLDTGVSRISATTTGRASLDGETAGMRGVQASVPPPLGGDGNYDDIKYMVDVLPRTDKALLRVYLNRCGGDQMRALGTYLEDEKNGTIRY